MSIYNFTQKIGHEKGLFQMFATFAYNGTKATTNRRFREMFGIVHAGFTFEYATCLRQMLQYPRQTVHLHYIADIVGNMSTTNFRKPCGVGFRCVSDNVFNLFLARTRISSN